MCRLLVDCDMNTPTKKALEAGVGPNGGDVRSVVGLVGGGEKSVVQVRVSSWVRARSQHLYAVHHSVARVLA